MEYKYIQVATYYKRYNYFVKLKLLFSFQLRIKPMNINEI
jgi:hypothetical protein